MTGEIRLRKAKSEDLETVYSLVKELAVYEKEPEAVTSGLSDYQEAMQSGLIEVILAETGDETAGMALYYDTFSTWKGKMLYLEDFYVKPEYRGKGIGKSIFEEVLREARRRECRMMKWQVLDWNEPAIGFYRNYEVTFDEKWVDCKIYF